MFRSIGGILPRETPKGGAEIHGQHIPEGVWSPSTFPSTDTLQIMSYR